MSNENNPHGLPPEFQELPEGFEQERRGDEYDAHGRQDPYGRQHDQGGPYGEHGHGQSYEEHAGHGESYEQYEQGDSYGQGEHYEQGDAYGQYEQGQPYGQPEHGDAYGRHEPPQGSYSDAYGSYGDQGGGWQPTPQGGEYDGEATAFFQLPEEFTSGSAPLEAPGHGYVPPMIRPLTPAAGIDPAAPGGWATPWPEPADVNADANVNVNETGQWAFHESRDVHEAHDVHDFHEAHEAHEAHDGHGVQGGHDAQGAQNARDAQDAPHVNDGREAYEVRDSGEFGESRTPQVTAPAAQGPQEAPHFPQVPRFSEFAEAQEAEPAASSDADSGEFPLPQGPDAPWAGTTPSATLPGGAPAPWATLPGGAAAPWATDESQRAEEPAVSVPEPVIAEPAAEGDAAAAEPVETSTEAAAESGSEAGSLSGSESPEPEPEPESAAGPRAGTEADPETGNDTGTDTEAQAVPADPDPAATTVPSAGTEEHPPTSYVLRVNGTDRPVSDAWIGESLLYVLRERLGLAGAKDGCSQGECGACNVQVDGRLVASCLVPAATAAGSEVRTVEGLATDGELSDVQRALAACGAVQCGFCIPGMAMTVHDLLEGNHAPTELETRQALCGNLCRCSGYRGVLDAVREVVAERAASATAASEAADAGDEARIPHQAAPGAGSVQIHPHDGGMA